MEGLRASMSSFIPGALTGRAMTKKNKLVMAGGAGKGIIG